jgi:hypothetical protein
MTLTMVVHTKSLHHKDAAGASIQMVQFQGENGQLGTIHLYMKEEEANAFALGSRHEVKIDPIVEA